MTALIVRKRGLGKRSVDDIVAASTEGVRDVRIPSRSVPASADWVIRWGYTGISPRATRGTVNTAEAIRWASNKARSREALQSAGVRVPQTFFDSLAVPTGTGTFARPYIVRPEKHFQSRNLVVVEDVGELDETVHRAPFNRGYYISALIDKVAEYRVFVAQGRAVWVASKEPEHPNSVSWGGGRFTNVRFSDWPLRAVKEAIRAMDVSPLDFGAVDVIVDREGNPYVLEINTAPGMESPYRASAVARVFDYVVRLGSKERIPLVARRGGYKKFAHPAVVTDALVV